MVAFWDSSALMPCLVAEPRSSECRGWLDATGKEFPAIWALTKVEIHSALGRLLHDKHLEQRYFSKAVAEWSEIERSFYKVLQVESVGERAVRLLRTHRLKAADALQLAAAIIAVRDAPGGNRFYCLDRRLTEAASKEGFTVVS